MAVHNLNLRAWAVMARFATVMTSDDDDTPDDCDHDDKEKE